MPPSVPQEPTSPPDVLSKQPCWAALQARLRSQGVEADEAQCWAILHLHAIPPEAPAEEWQEVLGRAIPVLARTHDGRA